MLVKQVEGVWTEFRERNADLYSQSRDMDITITASVADRLWSDEELADVGLKRAVMFVVPDGKVTVGAPTYEEDEAGSVNQVYTVEDAPGPTNDDVNAERERRVEEGGTFTISGAGDIVVTGRPEDARNLQGLAFAAQLRIGQGDTTTVTTFRDGTNTDYDLTPLQILDLWQKSAGFVSSVYQYSWALKAMSPIPNDYADDSYWSEG